MESFLMGRKKKPKTEKHVAFREPWLKFSEIPLTADVFHVLYMADPSALLDLKYSEDALTVALSRTCPCFLYLAVSLSIHAPAR